MCVDIPLGASDIETVAVDMNMCTIGTVLAVDLNSVRHTVSVQMSRYSALVTVEPDSVRGFTKVHGEPVVGCSPVAGVAMKHRSRERSSEGRGGKTEDEAAKPGDGRNETGRHCWYWLPRLYCE